MGKGEELKEGGVYGAVIQIGEGARSMAVRAETEVGLRIHQRATIRGFSHFNNIARARVDFRAIGS